MSDAVYLNFDDDPDEKPKRKKSGPRIVHLPDIEVPALDPLDERESLTRREKAIAVAKLNGMSFQAIADTFELSSAVEAKAIFDRAIAATHPMEDLQTMQRTAIARAEMLMGRSIAMATADYLVDAETGEKVANTERLKWHQQAMSDLMAHAAIAGTKAPSKVEVTASDLEIDRIVSALVAKAGGEVVVEAEVLELDVIPDFEDHQLEA